MNRNSKINSNVQLASQSGAVLVVGLVMLLLMTIVGLAAVRGSSLQEQMAGNMRDRNLAFQSAEAGLRAAEQDIADAGSPVFDGTLAGYFDAFVGVAPEFWDEYNWTGAGNSASTTMDLGYVSEQPAYVVEKVNTILDPGSEGSAIDIGGSDLVPVTYYRITSRGVGGTETAVAIVQSTFKTLEFNN